MKKICAISGKEFEITEEDLEFYKKMEIITDRDLKGLPTLCPDERRRKRHAFRNERSLHHRQCDGTQKKIISMYAPNFKFPVYENNYWWSDNWDGKSYGQDFDFSSPFFEQFNTLLKKVPKMARIQQGENENSTFCNCASWNKNSYLLFSANQNEDCLYCTATNDSTNCIDNLFVIRSELCYQSVGINNCYASLFLVDCDNCSDCLFCRDCIGCQDCFGCVNLKNKQYYFLNEKCTKEVYEAKIKNLEVYKYSKIKSLRTQFEAFSQKFPRKFMKGLRNQNVSGNMIYQSKKTQSCFDVNHLEDCKYCDMVAFMKSTYDVSYYGCSETNELLYECEGVGHGVFEVKFSKLVWGGSANVDYSFECFKCQHIFGCTGLKNAQYCILNKQYSKEEYFTLRDKIIEHMKKNGEWGEFFPIEISPFGYNETVAQEYFPLSQEEALKKGYQWHEEKNTTKYEGPKVEIPDSIQDVSDEILKQILECEQCQKNYRLVKPELNFYRKMNLPVPRDCPNCRHHERVKLRNPRKLWNRTCDKENCQTKFQTTFAPERPEKVYCEKCYLDCVD